MGGGARHEDGSPFVHQIFRRTATPPPLSSSPPRSSPMIRHGRILAGLLALIAGVEPVRGQAANPAPARADGPEARATGGAGAAGLREAGRLCLFDPAAGSRRLREAAILTEPATGDTFVALRPADRPLPLGVLFPPRNYVTSRP